MDVELGEVMDEIAEVDLKEIAEVDENEIVEMEPLRDHILHLARMIPAQCLDKTEPLYHPSTRTVYEFVCTSTGVHAPRLSAPVTDTPYVLEGIQGRDVEHMFPEFPPDAPLRFAAQYAVVCYLQSLK